MKCSWSLEGGDSTPSSRSHESLHEDEIRMVLKDERLISLPFSANEAQGVYYGSLETYAYDNLKQTSCKK